MDTSLNSSQRKSRRSRRRLEEEFGKCDREAIAQRKKSLRYSSGFFSGVTVDQDPHKVEKPHASLWILVYFCNWRRCDTSWSCYSAIGCIIPRECHVYPAARITIFGTDCRRLTLRCTVTSMASSNGQFISKIKYVLALKRHGIPDISTLYSLQSGGSSLQ